MASYGAIPAVARPERRAAPMLALMGLAVVAVVAVVTLSTQSRAVEMVAFPQDDLGILREMQNMAGPVPKMKVADTAASTKLSLPQQYARIMQNIGYFAPWSRQNSWADRIAINNIRKSNTPQSLAMKQEKIQKENEKFARRFSTPHTSMYTGVKQSIDQILDPKYQPWGNDGPRKAYYQGY